MTLELVQYNDTEADIRVTAPGLDFTIQVREETVLGGRKGMFVVMAQNAGQYISTHKDPVRAIILALKRARRIERSWSIKDH